MTTKKSRQLEPTQKVEKILPLDIWKETIEREKKNKVASYTVAQQQYNVIEDKINEIISHLNEGK